MTLFRSSGTTLGIEIVGGAFRYVELAPHAKGSRLVAFGDVALDGEGDFASALRRLVVTKRLTAKDVHLVDSTSKASLKIQTLPLMPSKEIAAILSGERDAEAELLGEPLAGDWAPLTQNANEIDVLVARFPRRDLERLERAVREAGLRLQMVSSSASVLADTLLRDGGVPEEGAIALVDLGRGKTNMALITKRGIRGVREMHQGLASTVLGDGASGEDIDLDAIGSALDEVRVTVEQIQRTIRQHERAHPDEIVKGITMTGETTRIARLVGVLQHDLRIPVLPYDPALRAGVGSAEFASVAASYAVPWALAESRAKQASLNFTEGVRDPRPRRALALAAASMLVAVGVSQGMRIVASPEIRRAREERGTLLDERERLEGELGRMGEIRAARVEWLQTSAAAADLPPPDLRPVVAAIISSLPARVRVTRLSFEQLEEGLTLEAEAVAFDRGAEACHESMARFARELARSPLLEGVRLLPFAFERERADSEPASVTFTIAAIVRASAAAASS